MVDNKVNNFLVPNISKLNDQKRVDLRDQLNRGEVSSEFNKIFNDRIDGKFIGNKEINLSSHALKRMRERNLEMDSSEYLKLKKAIDALKMKGGQDSLVVTNKAAYIIDVDNNKIVTAIDKGSITENVFTKIDSTMFVD